MSDALVKLKGGWPTTSSAVAGHGLPFQIIVFSILYFLAAKLGVATSLPPEGVVIIWPPNAIILITLLTVDRMRWPAFLVATVATEVAAGFPDYPLWAAAGYGTVNFAEATLAAYLLRRSGQKGSYLTGTQGFRRFLIAGPLVASALAALFGAAIYKVGAPELSYLHYWRVFWFGDALGLLVVGTTLLTFCRLPRWWTHAGLWKAAEAVGLLVCVLAVSGWAFFTGSGTARVYAVFPFLVWAAVRFGSHGAAFAVLATIGLAIASSTARLGPFAGMSSIDAVIQLQSLGVVVALSTFFLAFTVEDFWTANDRLRTEVDDHVATAAKLDRANLDLERINAELEDAVADRTRNLQRTLARNQVLLNEVHHRVKNSLQTIAEIISLQAGRGSAQELSQKVNKQVTAIAATYDIIHRMDSVESADLCLIVSEMCADISDISGGLVSLICTTSGQANVTADTAVALALALNELVTNSIKHASSRPGQACIRVDCYPEEGRAIVKIQDNGKGFAHGFDVTKSRGFGLRMTRNVISGVGGELQLGLPDDPTVVEVRLPLSRLSSVNEP